MPAGITARAARSQWPGCLLAFAGWPLFRSRVEKKLAHLTRRIAGDGTLARPRECLVHIGGFQHPETAYMLLGFGVRPVGDEHRAVGLLPHRLCVAGRGNPAGELPHAGSNRFAVERVDLLNRRFGYGGRVKVVGVVDIYTSNGRTGIRQRVQEMFWPMLRSSRLPARKARQRPGLLLFQPTTHKSSGLVRIARRLAVPALF
jgi:hypothetical protein